MRNPGTASRVRSGVGAPGNSLDRSRDLLPFRASSQYGQFHRAHLAIDFGWRPRLPIDSQELLHFDAKKPLIFDKVRANQPPILLGGFGINAAVELLFDQFTMRVPNVNRATRGQRKQITTRVRGSQFDHAPTRIELDAVQDNKSAAIKGIASHERLCQEVEASAVDDDARTPHRVDQWAPRCISKHVNFATLGAVHKRLAHIAINYEPPPFGNLAYLVLRVTVYVDMFPVHPAGEVIAT